VTIVCYSGETKGERGRCRDYRGLEQGCMCSSVLPRDVIV